jgi:NSS family neurotransmitter:Na+ symporter
VSSKRSSWKTRFGFYLAAIGSACGLGNLWRFPYVVGENGVGAFVLIYVLIALVIGLPLLIGELMLGKSTHKSILMAISGLEYKRKKPFAIVGLCAVLMSLVVLSYYAVISGWVLHYLVQFAVQVFGKSNSVSSGQLALLMQNGWLQIGLASVHLILTVVIVLKGVQEGLEKWIGYMMPVFTVLLIALVGRSLSLPSSGEAIRFLFYPDFSKLTLASLSHAIGHVFFTLSVGFGTMVTFGSYLNDGDHIPTAGFRVAVVDTALSLVAGLLIFSIALGASNVPLTDPGLMFESLPKFLLQMPGGVIFGFLFFVCLYLAALGASMGLLESIVSNGVERLKKPRTLMAWISGGAALILALGPAFSGSLFKGVKINGKAVLESLDSILINWLLPVLAIGLSLAISYGISKTEKEIHFVNDEKIESFALFPYWQVALRWIVPGFITLAILLQIAGLLLKS